MLTIEEYIKHCESEIEEYEKCLDIAMQMHDTESAKENYNLIETYKQLAAWLRELQELRKAPEIVRCGECKHNGTRNCMLNLWATIFNSKPKDDFFCGMAERRADENNNLYV